MTDGQDNTARPPQDPADRQRMAETVRWCAGWLYWIAVLGAIDGVVLLCGFGFYLISCHLEFGFGLTRLLLSADIPTHMVVGTLLACGIFTFLGARATRGRQWAFGAGALLYLLDGLPFFLAADVAGVLFHLVAIVILLRGAQVAGRLEAAGGPPEPAPKPPQERRLEATAKLGANAFFWVVALGAFSGLVMSVSSSLWGMPWRALFTSGHYILVPLRLITGLDTGLGVTRLFADIAGRSDPGSAIRLVGFIVTLAACGVIATFGELARRQRRWAWVAGIALYAVDGALFLALGGWLGAAFHGLMLVLMIRGARAMRATATTAI